MGESIDTVIENFEKEVDSLHTEIALFRKTPTKASAARVRKYSNIVGKSGVHIRKALIESDKKGY